MLPLATDDASLIYQECMTILNGLRLNCSDLRGIGIQVQKLESAIVGGSHQKKSQSILNFTTSTSMKIKIFHVSFVCLIFLHRIENVLKNGIYFYQLKRKFFNSFTEITSTKVSPHKAGALETLNNSTIIKPATCSTSANHASVGDTTSHKTKSADTISHIVMDPDARHWTDTLIHLDREVSPDKGSPEGALELHRHIENAFSQSPNNGDVAHDEGGNFLEGAVCQDLLSELSRYVEICLCSRAMKLKQAQL